MAARVACIFAGSSPHVRGAPGHDAIGGHGGGIIPACAGSTSAEIAAWGNDWDHPRMCGEHSLSTVFRGVQVGSSPHVRGARLGQVGAEVAAGIIPACAGSTHRGAA